MSNPSDQRTWPLELLDPLTWPLAWQETWLVSIDGVLREVFRIDSSDSSDSRYSAYSSFTESQKKLVLDMLVAAANVGYRLGAVRP